MALHGRGGVVQIVHFCMALLNEEHFSNGYTEGEYIMLALYERPRRGN